MIKVLAIVVAVVALTGCGIVERSTAEIKGYSKICVDGVTYLQFTSGATVQVDINGRPIACQ